MENKQNPQKISLVKVPNLKEMTREERREWAAQLHAILVAKLGPHQPGDTEKPDTQDRQSPAN